MKNWGVKVCKSILHTYFIMIVILMLINVIIFICHQETRHINAALIQHITFNEFLPMVLGKEVMHAHDLVLLKVTRLSISIRKECVSRNLFSGRLL